jgi:hypothetical protein
LISMLTVFSCHRKPPNAGVLSPQPHPKTSLDFLLIYSLAEY